MADEVNPGGEDQGTPTPPAPGTITVTQAELDSMMAKHKRGLQSELKTAQQKAAAFEALQGQVSDLLGSGLIDGVEDLEGFREAASQTIASARSEAEQAAARNKKIEADLKKANEVAEANRIKYESAMVERAISDSASELVVDGHGREGALEYFQLKLSPHAKVQEDGSVLVDWKVLNEDTGRLEMKAVPVSEALRSMEAEPTKYGRYFRSTVNGGSGGETIDGIRRTPDGGLDFANMDFNKFQELRSKNPDLLNEAASKLTF